MKAFELNAIEMQQVSATQDENDGPVAVLDHRPGRPFVLPFGVTTINGKVEFLFVIDQASLADSR